MASLLTAASVRRLKPGAHRIELRDAGCPGLILLIQPSGYKSWVMRFSRPNGELTRLTLGPVDLDHDESLDEPIVGIPLTLASARRLASEVNRERAMGRDFVAAKHQEKLEREARAAATFDQAALDFVEQHVRRKLRRWHHQAQLLGIQLAADGETLELVPKGLAARWRSRPISEIDADDIFTIVDEAREKGVPGRGRRNKGSSEPRARKMHGALSKMFGWLIERRRAKVNPCAGIKTDAPKARKRVLTDAEIAYFWVATDKVTKPFGQALKLLLLTGDRRNEVGGNAALRVEPWWRAMDHPWGANEEPP
jgi:Arm domain-containing DNA-binding protein